ncbi:MAG: deoxyribodipyrimidine photo-lyase [Rickettsiales bacterium]
MDRAAIIWLRRDLRLEDHLALHKAKRLGLKALPIFIFDENILKDFPNKRDRRISFIVDRLLYLNGILKRKNSSIKIFKGNPQQIFQELLQKLKLSHVIASAGYEEYDMQRDKNILDICKKNNAEFICENDHLIFSPETIKKSDGSIYQIYTPFAKSAFKKIYRSDFSELDSSANLGRVDIHSKFILDTNNKNLLIEKLGYNYTSYNPWCCDFNNKNIGSFRSHISDYKKNRDLLYTDSTSKFSPYLRFGFISIRACLRFALEHKNSVYWINELIWRDFYATCLFHFPEFASKSWTAKYRKIDWPNNETYIKKFEQCETGYPIIDAAMTQLKTTGWMHNRARMIVASFFTKDLLCDWRLGEKIFAKYLLDYELSSNVGGWQWAASTGFDAQPYFRIFNPYLQSKRFDPAGKYIKELVPRLKNIMPNNLHSAKIINEYHKPIVSHDEMRKKALRLYKSN